MTGYLRRIDWATALLAIFASFSLAMRRCSGSTALNNENMVIARTGSRSGWAALSPQIQAKGTRFPARTYSQLPGSDVHDKPGGGIARIRQAASTAVTLPKNRVAGGRVTGARALGINPVCPKEPGRLPAHPEEAAPDAHDPVGPLAPLEDRYADYGKLCSSGDMVIVRCGCASCRRAARRSQESCNRSQPC